MYIFIIALYVMLLSMRDTAGTRNVGTVLFSKNDVHNRKWSKDTLALLQARMYFQRIVPPFSSPRSDVPEYVNGLLRFLRNSYATIRKESADKATDRILTIAFTDVMGGYLKMFALPIAKYAYYGGTLPKEETLKLFLFYEDAKRYLRNNGSTWARPDVSLLNSVTINVAYTPFAFIRTNEAADPCVFLSYFEKTPTGLTIPTPRIDWSSCTMFIPLANHSFVNLYSAKRATDLHNYYNIATNCVRTKRPSSLDMFTHRFQSWLQGDVVPHLNDDHLYPALQGILSLLNNTGSIAPYSVLNNVMNEINTDADRIGLDIRCTSKKLAIIIIIVLLELAWCIPTLLFVLYRNVNKKDTSKKDTTRTSLIFRSHSSSTGCRGSDGTVFTPRWHVKKKHGGLRLQQKPFAMMEIGEVYSSLSMMSVVTQTKEPPSARPIDVATMVDEALNAKKRKQMLKDSGTQPEERPKGSLGLLKKDASNETWTKQQSSDDTGKTVTLSSNVTSKNTKIQQRRAKKREQDNSTCTCIEDNMDTFRAPRPPTETTDSIKTVPDMKTETTSIKDSTSLKIKLSTPGFVGTPDDKILKPKRMSKAKFSRHAPDDDYSKYKTADKPYLEIRIDRPKQGISVGITRKEEKKESPKVDHKSFNNLEIKSDFKTVIKTDSKADLKTNFAIDNAEVPNKTDNVDNNVTNIIIAGKKINGTPDTKVQRTDYKVSRIPKRSTSPHTIPCGVTRQRAVGTTPRFNVAKEGTIYRKSMIPKPKRAKDDSAFKREKGAKSAKLNVTL